MNLPLGDALAATAGRTDWRKRVCDATCLTQKAPATKQDFDGQQRAERLFQIIMVIFSVVGFVWGYICQQFSQTMYVLFVGLALSCLLTLPPWPMYRKKPVQWQKVQETDDTSSETKTKKTPKSKKKKDN